LSQGLLLPMGILENYARGDDGDGNMTWYDPHDFYQEGEDVTEVLGIIKWEAPLPACLAGDARGPFPSSIPKTDQPRIQNLMLEIEDFRELTFEVSEKLEGSSCTKALIDGEFHVCSRNLSLKPTEGNTYWKVAFDADIEAKMREFGLDNFAIQSEVVGPGIQGNIYKLSKHEFYVFDIFDIKRGVYLSSDERLALCEKLKIKHVPIIGLESLKQKSIEDIVSLADGLSQLNNNVLREGIVFKSISSAHHFKSISNQYLLKSNL
jgi:RNA ligase (TIGR02306 family)